MSEETTEMGLFETIYNCRAMRKLDTTEVPEEHLVKLVSAANQAPSGSNTQGARWIVVRDPETKAQLAALNKTGVDKLSSAFSRQSGQPLSQPADKRQRMVNAGRLAKRSHARNTGTDHRLYGFRRHANTSE